jgi:hypothetical protein
VVDKTTSTTLTRDIKSGELEKKISETTPAGGKTETTEKTSVSGEVTKEIVKTLEGGKVETIKEVTDKETGKIIQTTEVAIANSAAGFPQTLKEYTDPKT